MRSGSFLATGLCVRPARIASIVAAVLVCSATSACQLYDPNRVGGAGGGGGGFLTQVPPRPEMNELPDVDATPTFALRNVVLDQGAEWAEIGIDLDGIHTTGNAGQACEPASTLTPQVDGVGGIDNVFGRFFYPVLSDQLAPLDPQLAARAAHDAGDGTMIARMTGWNGLDNDERVTVVFVQAVDGTPLPRDQVMMDEESHRLVLVSDPSTEAPPPAWDPEQPDHWWVRDDGFVGGNPNEPWQKDTNAYVSNGVLVMTLKANPIMFRMGEYGVRVVYRNAWVLATFSPDFQHIDDVVVAGRWSVQDLLTTAYGVGLCPWDEALTTIDTIARSLADVYSDAALDGTGHECDAVSMAVRFEEGVPADWDGSAATVVEGIELTDHCAGGPPGDGGV